MLVAGAGIALAGCATMSGGIKGDVARSMSEVASASQSAVIVFDQYGAGSSTGPVTGTTLDDMLDEVETADTAVAELDVGAPDEVAVRDQAAALIRDCIDALNAARGVVAGLPAPDAAAGLTNAADRATELSEDLEQYK